MKDPYSILGVSKTASEDEIKRAYRKMAQKHHPDRNKGDKPSEEKFKEINAAYEILGDKKKRQTYDQFGENAFHGGASGGQGFPGGFDFSGFQDMGGGFADIFESFFGGHGGSSRQKTGAQVGDDREASITITFEEAAFGTEKEIKLTRIGECSTCSGKGTFPGSKMITCNTCGGTGEIKSVRSTILGQVAVRRVCDECAGVGKIPERKCTNCHGVGRMRIADTIKIKIPAGIPEDATMRIAGKGNSGLRGGPAGDLYTHIRIVAHKKFSRRNLDVYSTQQIHLVQAVLGDTINVGTLHGQVAMRVPAGTESGKMFKLKNYGIPKMKSQDRGDHFVTIEISVPKKITKKEKELYEQLAKESGLKIKEEKGFFGF